MRGGGGAFWLPLALHRVGPDETLQYHTCFRFVTTRISVGFEEAAELGRLPHLTELDLGVNRTLDDEGVAALAGATELRALHLALCSGVHLGWGPLNATRADSGQQSYRAILSRPDLSPSQSTAVIRLTWCAPRAGAPPGVLLQRPPQLGSLPLMSSIADVHFEAVVRQT